MGRRASGPGPILRRTIVLTLKDLAYALTQLRRSPAFAAAAILTLALGIGSNAAIFQALDAVRFRSLPVQDPQSLVRLQLLENGKPLNFSYPLYREMAARQQVASGMFATSGAVFGCGGFTGGAPARTSWVALGPHGGAAGIVGSLGTRRQLPRNRRTCVVPGSARPLHA